MNVTVENLAPCRKLLRVDVDAQTVDQAFEEVTTELQKEVKIPGFRPGKAPKQMVVQSYGKLLEEEVRKKVLRDTYRKAIDEQKLHPVGNPEIEEIEFGRGKGYQYAVTVDTAPDFELPEYKGLPVKKEARTVTDEDVAKAIDVLRERQATYNDVQRPAQNGDFVVVNYDATTEGKPLTDFAPTARGLTTNKNFWVEIKEGSFVPGFTEQLVGLSAGDKKMIEVDFPADFVAPQLSGKHAVYEVEVVNVKEKALPPFDEAFAKSYGAESIEKLREGVRKDLEKELDRKTHAHIRQQLVERLNERVNYDLPESLLQQATKNKVYEAVYESQQRGVTHEQIQEQKDNIYQWASSSARQGLKTAFLLGKIAEKEKITVSSEELSQRIMYMAYQRQVSPQKLAKDLQKSGEIRSVHEEALMAKVIDFLEKHAQIEEVPPGQPA